MKGNKFFPAVIVLVILLVLSTGLSAAQGPVSPQGQTGPQVTVGSTFTYQGQLKKDGNPINATCAMTFTLYDDSTAGNQVGDPLNANVDVSDGLFTVPLNFGDMFTGDARWLEIAVNCPGDAGASTLSPRQELTATPYALSLQPGAVISGTALAAPLGKGAVLKVHNSASMSSAYGVYGLSDSTDGTGVRGWATATSGTTYGVSGRVDSPEGRALRGLAMASTGSSYGVYGESASTGGFGVYGYATADSGSTYGVYGQADSTNGIGVRGWATAASGPTYGVAGRTESPDGQAVRGLATATTGSPYGVYGESAGTAGIAVRGWATSATGISYGVHGQTESPEGRGVCGYATSASGTAWGVYGRSNSSEGYGVYGNSAAASGYTAGVYGTSWSPNGAGVIGVTSAAGCTQCSGVYGSSDDGVGVYGNTLDGAGVYGFSNGNGVAIRAEGQYNTANLIEAWHGPLFLDRKFYVDGNGNVYADGSYLSPASGFAQMLPGAAGLEAGDVLVMAPDGSLTRCDAAYQPTVVGVYAPQSGVVSGKAEDTADQVPVAVMGIVQVKASAENGPIALGDLLVAAATPGHAMRAGDSPAPGTVIGKALGTLDKDTGTLLMLVMLR